MNRHLCARLSKPISLPKDTGKHRLANTEWWYYFAFLEGDKGGKYATMASFFHIGDFPFCKGHYLIFSLIDLKENSYQSYSFADRRLIYNILLRAPFYLFYFPYDKKMWKQYLHLLIGKLPSPHQMMRNACIKSNPTQLLYGESSLSFIDETKHHFNVHVVENNNILDLKFAPTKPIALIGKDGKPNQLYYYSFTQNKVKGYIKKGKTTENVKGRGWFDDQWGYANDLLTKTGWNWFGLQLEDGRELLINEFRDIKTGKTFSPMANLIKPNGELEFTRKVVLEPIQYWKSPLTKTSYPLEWLIKIPDFSMNIKVVPKFKEQEMPILGPLQAIWEGACNVSVDENLCNQQIKRIFGKGFMELVGYAN